MTTLINSTVSKMEQLTKQVLALSPNLSSIGIANNLNINVALVDAILTQSRTATNYRKWNDSEKIEIANAFISGDSIAAIKSKYGCELSDIHKWATQLKQGVLKSVNAKTTNLTEIYYYAGLGNDIVDISSILNISTNEVDDELQKLHKEKTGIRTRYSKELVAAVLRLVKHHDDLTYITISSRLNVGYKTVSHIAIKHGITRRNKSKHKYVKPSYSLTKRNELMLTAKTLKDKGHKVTTISEQLGVAVPTVYQWLKKSVTANTNLFEEHNPDIEPITYDTKHTHPVEQTYESELERLRHNQTVLLNALSQMK